MADPCPDIDPDEYETITYDDCEGFDEDADPAEYEVIEFVDCEGFDALVASGDYEVLEYDEDATGCDDCCGGCCFTDASVLPDDLYITVDGATFVISVISTSGGCKVYSGGNGDYGVSELQICAGCNVVGNLFDNFHGGGACGDTSLSPDLVRCWSPFNYFQTVTYPGPGPCAGITFDITICESDPCPDVTECDCHGPDYPLPMSAPAPTAARVALPCVSLGDSLTGAERAGLGLDHRRNWQWCGKGYGTGGAVCRCKGCGPQCPGYEADPTDPAA